MAQIGYFPGQPIQRPPKAGKPLPPQQYDFDVVSKWIKDTFRDIDFGNLPKGVYDDIVSDVQRQLKVSASPKKEDYDVQRALEYGDINETPGVQLQLNINPLDWANDPAKTLDKTIGGFQQSIFKWDDVRNYVEKKYFWEPVIAGRTDLSPKGSAVGALDFGEVMAKRLMGIDPTLPPDQLQPFQMTGIDVKKTPAKDNQGTTGGGAPDSFSKKDRDLYDETGQSFLKFIDKAHAAGSRNGAISGLRSKAMESIDEELAHAVSNYAVTAASREAINNFRASYNVLYAMNELRAGPTGKSGLAMASNNLGSIVLEGVGSGSGSAQRGAANFVTGGTLGVGDTLKALWNPDLTQDSTIKKNLDVLRDARASLTNTNAQEAFDKATRAYRKKIEEIQAVVEASLKRGASIENRLQASLIKGRLDVLSKSLVDSNAFGKGIEFHFTEHMQASFLAGRDPLLGTNLGSALKEVSDLRNAAGLKSGFANTSRILSISNTMYAQLDMEDLLKNIEGGKLREKYLYPLLRTYVETLSPAVYLRDRLAATHYFGLKYDPDAYVVQAHKHGHYFGENAQHEYNEASLGAFNNKWCPTNTLHLELDVVGKVALAGGNHFEGAVNYYKLFSMKDPADPTKWRLLARLDPKTGEFVEFEDRGLRFLKFLNGDRAGFSTFIPAGKPDALDKWLKQSDRFRIWLKKNNDKYGLGLKFDALDHLIENGVDGEKNAKIIGSLISKIGARAGSNDFISPLWERAGRLQILSSWVNQAQTEVLKRISIYLAPFIKLLNGLTSRVSMIVTQLLTKLFAGATGGIGAFLAPLLDKILGPLIKFITGAIMSRLGNLFKALFTGDFSGFLRDQEKLMAATMKGCLFFLGFPVLIVFFICFLLFGTTLTTMPTVDHTRSGGLKMTTYGLGGAPADCNGPGSDDDGDLAALSGATDSIAIKGFELVQGSNKDPKTGLARGFWCFWNQHMDFPQFWDQAYYDENPFPDPAEARNHGDAMFWCTYLVLEAYNRGGVSLPWSGNTGVLGMATTFGWDRTLVPVSTIGPNYSFIANNNTDIKKYGVHAGDVVFFLLPDENNNWAYMGHVALVYSVTSDTVETIHSNSNVKRWSFVINPTTGAVQGNAYFKIIGFGRAAGH